MPEHDDERIEKYVRCIFLLSVQVHEHFRVAISAQMHDMGKFCAEKRFCIYESQVVLGLPVKEQCASIWLVRGSNDVLMSSDAGNGSMLALLDLSSAFDTFDYHILIKKLHDWVGIAGSAQDRRFTVSIGDFLSGLSPLSCGVAQGS